MHEDPAGQAKLSNLLLICFDTLDNYGKEPDQLKNINAAFQKFLGKFTYQKIEEGFYEYMENYTVMPKPADIIKIIDKPVYVPSTHGLSDGQLARLEALRKAAAK